GLLGMIVERLDINLYGESRVSVSALFMITVAVALGATATVVVCPAVALAGHMGRGRPLYKLIFNTSVFMLAALASAATYSLAARYAFRTSPFEVAAMMLAALANFGVGSTLVAAIVAATTGKTLRTIWSEKFL